MTYIMDIIIQIVTRTGRQTGVVHACDSFLDISLVEAKLEGVKAK